ncbi:hypothetical protein [Halostagnicola bangensis]
MSGITAASLAGASTVGSASAESNAEPDTDFTPQSRKEVVGFLNDVDEFPEEQQQQYANELDGEQKQAIVDLYADAEWEFTTYQVDRGSDLQPFSSYETTTEVTVAEGQVTGIGTVYEHEQTLTWDYNGSDYENVSQELDYDLDGPFATFKGKTEDTIDERSTSFTATLSAEYEADVLGYTRGGEATIVTQGDEDGNFELLSRDAPTS